MSDTSSKRIPTRKERAKQRKRQRRMRLYLGASCAVLCVLGIGLGVLVHTWTSEAEGVETSAAALDTGIVILAQSPDTGLTEVSRAGSTGESPTPRSEGTTAEKAAASASRDPFAATPTPEPTPNPRENRVLITGAGDCTLGGDYGESSARRFQETVEKLGYDYFFANVRDIFTEDDFTVVNLEGPLTTSTKQRSGRQFNFRGAPENVQILSGSSVEVCSLANNHALDFSKEGLIETAQVLTDAGIGAAGYENAYYAEKNGVRVGFLSYTEWDCSAEEIARRVSAAKENCDLLIVSMHWGAEARYSATSRQEKYGRAIVDAGADLVLGHHSHVVGGIEQYRGKYIVYSLGNFCFGGNRNPRDKNCMIFQQEFFVDAETGTVTDAGIRILPCSISSTSSTNNYQPTPLRGEASAAVLKTIAENSSVDMEKMVWLEDFSAVIAPD